MFYFVVSLLAKDHDFLSSLCGLRVFLEFFDIIMCSTKKWVLGLFSCLEVY
jgi:hypothetical protein